MDQATNKHRQRGQGLVEYALILVLVAVVVIAILTLLGPQVGNVFSRVVDGLGVTVNTGGGGGPGGGGGGTATVLNATVLPRTDSNLSVSNITVSENTSITLVDQVGGASRTVTCNGTCSVTFDLGHSGGGTVRITAPGNAIDRNYGPAPSS